ncbi:MAG: hypothetical protein AB7L09_02505 [Nitrospira sp.]
MSRYSYRGNNDNINYYVGSGVVMALLILYFGICGGAGKMAQVVYASSAFWFLTLISLAIGVGVKLKNPREFTWPEYVLYFEFCLCVMFGLYALMFSTSTDLVRTEVWNGRATSAYYQEQHTDRRTVTDYDSKGKPCGSHTEYYTHFAEYGVSSTAGDYGGSPSIYNAFKQRWHNEQSHLGSCASAAGPFSVYTVSHDGSPHTLVPVAREHNYVNFVTASDSIRKLNGLVHGYERFLQKHPRTHNGPYGCTELDRVVVAGAPVRSGWTMAVDQDLDMALVELGPGKQCNIVVYIVGSSDQAFAHALEEHWKLGEKNDIVVVIGAPNFPEVSWAYVMAWTDVQDFKIGLREKILNMGKDKTGDARGIGFAPDFVKVITDQVRLSSAHGGYQRKPMSDYDYLISEISLPWWASLIIVILGGALQFGAACFLIHNDVRD